jgi:hypothetical protein
VRSNLPRGEPVTAVTAPSGNTPSCQRPRRDLQDRLFGSDPDVRRFASLIALATLTPFVFMPIAQRWNSQEQSVLGITGLLIFLGGPAHVSATAYLYTDATVRRYIAAHRLRYLIVPLVLMLGSTAIFGVYSGRQPAIALVFFFQIWLLWHYQKQNYGILAMVSRAATGEGVSRLEAWAVRAAAVGGILAAVQSQSWGSSLRIGGTTPFVHRSAILIVAVLVGGVATLVLLVAAVSTQPKLRSPSPRIIVLVLTCAYFAPAFIWRDQNTAFYTYALAHGLQYLIIMSFVAGRPIQSAIDGPAKNRPGFPTLLLCVLTLGIALAVTGDARLVVEQRVVGLYGLALGLTMAHFVIDAGIWKLRHDFPRQYATAAFPFLLPHGPGRAEP